MSTVRNAPPKTDAALSSKLSSLNETRLLYEQQIAQLKANAERGLTAPPRPPAPGTRPAQIAPPSRDALDATLEFYFGP